MKSTNKITSCFAIMALAVLVPFITQSCCSSENLVLELPKEVSSLRIKNEAGAVLTIGNDNKNGRASKEVSLCKGETIRIWGAEVSQSDSGMKVSFSGESRVIRDSQHNYVLIITKGEHMFGKDVGWELAPWE